MHKMIAVHLPQLLLTVRLQVQTMLTKLDGIQAFCYECVTEK